MINLIKDRAVKFYSISEFLHLELRSESLLNLFGAKYLRLFTRIYDLIDFVCGNFSCQARSTFISGPDSRFQRPDPVCQPTWNLVHSRDTYDAKFHEINTCGREGQSQSFALVHRSTRQRYSRHIRVPTTRSRWSEPAHWPALDRN